MRSLRVCTGVGAVLILSVLTAAGNGNKAKKELYDGKAGAITFTVELEPIPFQITAVQNRYRLVRIRIVNAGSTPLVLSAQGDKVTVFSRDGEAEGILDIGRRDAPLWDGFPVEVRTMLAYPTVVKAREEESVFVFFDAGRLKSTPGVMVYKIAALKDEVPLTRRGATAAH